MDHITLRQYQWDAVRFTVDALREGASSAAVIAPTGSGKTTIVTSILHKMPGLHSVFVAAPQEAIERGFLSDDVYQAPVRDVGGSRSNPVIGRGHRYVPFREDGRDKVGRARDLLSGVTLGVDNWGLTTHSQMCEWGTSFLPDDLTGHLLVVDEAHHAGSSDDEGRTVTRLGEIADTWRARGGMVLYVTATPYRSDGERVLPEGTSTWTWTIADHAASGYAPSNFVISTVATGVTVSTPTEFYGDALPSSEGDGGHGYDAMVNRWVADGRPKAVFIVPSRNSTEWAARLERALVDAGARVCNAVGADADTKARFVSAIDAERAATTYAGSSVDVFIACKRFDEGTDWPLCSHVYNWGVPSSFGLIVQRWGRTFRDKSKYPDYPDEFRQTANMTFIVPTVAEEARERFGRWHLEHSWLTSTHLADWETGMRYRADMRMRFERAWSKRPDPRDDELLSLFGDLVTYDELDVVRAVQAATVPDHIRVKALALIGQVELALGGEPSVRDVVARIEANGTDPDVMNAVVAVLAERLAGVNAGAGGALDDGIDRIASGGSRLGDVVRREVSDLYRSVVDRFGDRSAPVAGAAMAFVTQFTGTDAKDMANRLRDALSKPDLTAEMIKEAVVKFRGANGGRNPTARSSDATPYFGFSKTWSSVNYTLNQSRSSLAVFLVDHGFVERKPDLTVEVVKEAIVKFREANEGKNPTLISGDATPYFGFTEKWADIHDCLRHGRRGFTGRSSLAVFLVEHGFIEPKPDLTVEMVKEAVVKFRAENDGKNPSFTSGDATPYFGYPDTWSCISQCLSGGHRGLPGGSSLRRFLIEHGFAEPRPDFTIETIREAVVKFRTANDGKNPTQIGDATPYFGYPETWRNVDGCLREGLRGLPGGSSLMGFLVEHGFSVRKPNLTVEMVKEAVVKFREANDGKNPTPQSGDAMPYFGFPEAWGNVDEYLRGDGKRGLPGGSSLRRFLIEHGFAEPKPDFTIETIREAVVKFREANSGGNPMGSSGDATPYFGFPTTWKVVDSCLYKGMRGLPGGSSILRFLVEHGFAERKSSLTVDMIRGAVLRYRETNGGGNPTRSSGDATSYFGFPETWGAVNAALKHEVRGLPGGSSLFKLCASIPR